MRAYNKDAADVIIERLSTTTQGLRRICKEIGISANTVYDWIIEDVEGFGKRYTRAKQLQADVAVEEAYDIADDTTKDSLLDEFGNKREDKEWTNRSRLRVDLRKWHASKLAPKVYGDRVGIDMDVKLAATIQIAPPDQYLGGGQKGIDVAQEDGAGEIIRDVRFLRADQVREMLRAGKSVSDADVVDEDDNE